ncbi:hypothetical protein Agabi119p4_5271 [Agaricus bisporus var. burnettii]|uniref:DRBM domain-containing protein n=1 Tax=Agaricus bisporus var. burnettii TaxID=192524 RepID=A0A8H7F1E0_AGABI|nr:dsRNA-binding protein [Agaricus bisporus var. bisporus H97]EKV48770.1 dsRNA-binding protein [Agaricus bisporus var. bisporus H97]KAF7773104.1 hypothetical protein Agabi119p4_5271 [Agaricus bisporus var. burnettii]
MSTQENGYRNKLNTVCDRQKWAFQKGECVPSGSKNQTVWTGQVYVNKTPFEGKGSSKGAAWEAAAKNALDHIKANNSGVVDD